MKRAQDGYRRLDTTDDEPDYARSHLTADYEGSSRSGNDIELRSRNDRSKGANSFQHSRNGSDVILIDRKLKEGETLQKLCLQYSVSQAELKRVNNLLSDQDFYALSFIKIPVKPYSHAELTLLTEGGQDAEDTSPYLPIDLNHYETQSSTRNDWMIPPGRSDSPTSNTSDDHQKKFATMLKNVDNSVEKAKQAAELRDNGLFSANEGDNNHFVPATSLSLSHFMERSLCHYIVLVLCVFLIIIIPLSVLVYAEVITRINGNDNIETPENP